MTEKTEDVRLLMGGKGCENDVPTYWKSPTWVVDEVWEECKKVANHSLAAYMLYCKNHNLPHSYYLGLDILITAQFEKNNPNKLVDIKPVILEGPCCNSYPASQSYYPMQLYKQAKAFASDLYDPDWVDYDVHPTETNEVIVQSIVDIYKSNGGVGMPNVGLFTRSYPESEEETAHEIIIETFRKMGVPVWRITPDERPYVKNGRLWVDGHPMHVCFRRIERIHVPVFYGWQLGLDIVQNTPATIWLNDFKVDDLRSKTLEEKAFREYEAETGNVVSRPVTLIGKEITPDAVRELVHSGGFAIKLWNSTGGKGVFLHVAKDRFKNVLDTMYNRYDGRHMVLMADDEIEEKLKMFENYKIDASIQQLRLIDSRDINIDNATKLVYDTRMNVIYNELQDKWIFLSGISRVVPCGVNYDNGNSLLTNVSSGAFMTPLITGKTKDKKYYEKMELGTMAKEIVAKKTEINFAKEPACCHCHCGK